MADVAQLVRALVCGTRCRQFESDHPPHFAKSLSSDGDFLWFKWLFFNVILSPVVGVRISECRTNLIFVQYMTTDFFLDTLDLHGEIAYGSPPQDEDVHYGTKKTLR